MQDALPLPKGRYQNSCEWKLIHQDGTEELQTGWHIEQVFSLDRIPKQVWFFDEGWLQATQGAIARAVRAKTEHRRAISFESSFSQRNQGAAA